MTDAAPDPVRYLDQVARTDPARGYKRAMVDALDLRPGQTVLDLGCGPGADLTAFADAVGPRGRVLGRRLVHLVTERGLVPRTADGTTIVFRDFAAADAVLGLRRNAHRAVTVGFMTEDAAGAWLDRLGRGPFFAAFVLFSVTAEVPP
jgi:hypothetical protein